MKIFSFPSAPQGLTAPLSAPIIQKAFFSVYKIVIILSTAKFFNEKCRTMAAFSNFSLIRLRV